MSFAITCDSSADIGDIGILHSTSAIPFHITLGQDDYKDGENILPSFIYTFFDKTGSLPKTNAPSVSEYLDFFEKIGHNVNSIIHLSMSSELSCAHSNALLAAEQITSTNVKVIDTKSLSGGLALIAIRAHEMRADGLSAQEAYEKLKAHADKLRVSFIIDSLLFLYKGGRCSAAEKIGAVAFSLKPSVTVGADGKMHIGKKYIGSFKKCAEKYISDELSKARTADASTAILYYTPGTDSELINTLAGIIKASEIFSFFTVAAAGCTITSHCGKNTLGLLYFSK